MDLYSRSSASLQNFAQIGQADFEIIGLTGIVISKEETEAEQTACLACFQQPGRLNDKHVTECKRDVANARESLCIAEITANSRTSEELAINSRIR